MHSRLVAVGIPIDGVGVDDTNDKTAWRVVFLPEATSEQRDRARAIIDAFDVNAPTQEETEAALLAAERLEWLTNVLAEKTPAEVRALAVAQLSGITTLAQARAVLLTVIPDMAWAITVLAHQVIER